jgi:hypothetical protein
MAVSVLGLTPLRHNPEFRKLADRLRIYAGAGFSYDMFAKFPTTTYHAVFILGHHERDWTRVIPLPLQSKFQRILSFNSFAFYPERIQVQDVDDLLFELKRGSDAERAVIRVIRYETFPPGQGDTVSLVVWERAL